MSEANSRLAGSWDKCITKAKLPSMLPELSMSPLRRRYSKEKRKKKRLYSGWVMMEF